VPSAQAEGRALSDHDCETVPEAGFGGKKNGQLLSLAEAAGCELFFMIDKGLHFQQNMIGRVISILIVRARMRLTFPTAACKVLPFSVWCQPCNPRVS
jgi:hypothetical protein